MRLKRALWIAFISVTGRLTLMSQVEAHTGEGFHPEVLWDLLKTTLLVVLAVAAVIGVLWLYGRTRSQRKP
mgnify:CR=1 FL=1